MSKLAVELKTNYVVGVDFKFVHVQLFISIGGPLFGSFTEVFPSEAFDRGHRVCDIDGINTPGDYNLVVQLLNQASVPVALARIPVRILTNTARRVEIIKPPIVVEGIGFIPPPPIIPR